MIMSLTFSLVDEGDESPTPKKRGRGRPSTKKTSTAADSPPRIAKRDRTPNRRYIPPEATHKNNLAKACEEAPVRTNKRRGGRRKAASTKEKEVQPRRPPYLSHNQLVQQFQILKSIVLLLVSSPKQQLNIIALQITPTNRRLIYNHHQLESLNNNLNL